MNVLSLFDGLSGGRIALDRLGIKIDNYYSSEIDKFAIQVSTNNYPDIIRLGSIIDLSEEQLLALPKIDLLIGGSPCQGFSLAGHQKGSSTKEGIDVVSLEQYLDLKEQGFEFNGQSYLFWEYVRVWKIVKPTYFFLENVKITTKWLPMFNNAMLFDSEWNKSKYMKAILDLEKRTCNIKNKYSDEKMANELIIDKYSVSTPVKNFKETLKRLKNKIRTSNLYKILQANIIQGTLFNNIEIGLISDLEKLITNLNFLIKDDQESKDKEIFYIQYSPVKGIPILVSSLNTGRFFLKNKVWNNISNFVGLSGTLSYSLSLDKSSIVFNQEAYKYLFYRLGVASNAEINTNSSLVDVKVQPRIFNKNKVEIYLPNKSLTSKDNNATSCDNLYNEEFDITKSKYYEERLLTIRKAQSLTNHSKNAVVLCGGYTEAYILSERYKELFPTDEIVLCSNKQEKTNSTIERFLNSGKIKPTILFATRNFGTGVSLAGEALINLYLLRLPYTDQNKFKWASREGSKTNWTYYQNEMVITFAQNMGRLQRTMNDYGSIFILDERFYQKSINKKLRNIVESYGIVQRNTIDISNEFNTHWGTNTSTINANLNDVGEIVKRVTVKNINELIDNNEDLANLF